MHFRRCGPDDAIQWEMVRRTGTSSLPRAESAPALVAGSADTTNTSATDKTRLLNKLRKSRGPARLRDEIKRTTPSSAIWLDDKSPTTIAPGVLQGSVPRSSCASTLSTVRFPRDNSSLASTSLVSRSAEFVEDVEPLLSLEMIEEREEILQDEETQYTYHVHSRDDTFSTVDTSVLDFGVTRLSRESGLDQNSLIDTALWNRDRKPQQLLHGRQRSESRDIKRNRRKMVVVNGDLKDEQRGSTIEVQPPMEEFCNFSKPLGKSNSVHQGNKDSARPL